MTVSVESAALEAEEPVESETSPVTEDGTASPQRGLGRLPEVALGMACASLIVAAAFAGARSGKSWATDLFWVGQVALYAIPAAFLLFRRSILRAEAFGIALLMPIASFLILAYYSPDQFRFLDEFQHVQTAQTILATHHLFHVNTSLPVSPQYPGLEIITSALVAITHLSITTSGMIVTGVAHVLGRGVSVLSRPGSAGSPSCRGIRRRHLRHGTALSILRFVFHLPDDRTPVPPSLASRRGEDGQEQRRGGQRLGSGRARLRSGHRGESPHHELRVGRGALRLRDRATVPPPTGSKLAGCRCLSRRRGHGGGVGPRYRHRDAELHKTDLSTALLGRHGALPNSHKQGVAGKPSGYRQRLGVRLDAAPRRPGLLRSLASVEVASRPGQRSFPRPWASGR